MIGNGLLLLATMAVVALWLIVNAIVGALMALFLKLVAADNTQRAADQERHGEAPCPPSIITPFHDAFDATGGQ